MLSGQWAGREEGAQWPLGGAVVPQLSLLSREGRVLHSQRFNVQKQMRRAGEAPEEARL